MGLQGREINLTILDGFVCKREVKGFARDSCRDPRNDRKASYLTLLGWRMPAENLFVNEAGSQVLIYYLEDLSNPISVVCNCASFDNGKIPPTIYQSRSRMLLMRIVLNVGWGGWK
jgi:hypothetical protein